jgi:hypothetical protein
MREDKERRARNSCGSGHNWKKQITKPQGPRLSSIQRIKDKLNGSQLNDTTLMMSLSNSGYHQRNHSSLNYSQSYSQHKCLSKPVSPDKLRGYYSETKADKRRKNRYNKNTEAFLKNVDGTSSKLEKYHQARVSSF